MLYFQTVTPTLLKIIRAVSGEPSLRDFRLVGGTALSLYLGHRKSVDADFFSNKDFDKDEANIVLSRLLPGFMVLRKSAHGFAAMYEQVKMDMYTWQMPFLLPAVETDGIRMAALPDIAALKLEAVSNRKEEKDFRDIHALLQRFSLAELLGFFRERYPNHSPRIVTDHLLAAPFVERDPTIGLFSSDPWEIIGADIVGAVTAFYEESTRNRARLEEERLRQRLDNLKKGDEPTV